MNLIKSGPCSPVLCHKDATIPSLGGAICSPTRSRKNTHFSLNNPKDLALIERRHHKGTILTCHRTLVNADTRGKHWQSRLPMLLVCPVLRSSITSSDPRVKQLGSTLGFHNKRSKLRC